ncbi:hypothetical protein GVAV_002888 [Gurleya vavrai]
MKSRVLQIINIVNSQMYADDLNFNFYEAISSFVTNTYKTPFFFAKNISFYSTSEFNYSTFVDKIEKTLKIVDGKMIYTFFTYREKYDLSRFITQNNEMVLGDYLHEIQEISLEKAKIFVDLENLKLGVSIKIYLFNQIQNFYVLPSKIDLSSDIEILKEVIDFYKIKKYDILKGILLKYMLKLNLYKIKEAFNIRDMLLNIFDDFFEYKLEFIYPGNTKFKNNITFTKILLSCINCQKQKGLNGEENKEQSVLIQEEIKNQLIRLIKKKNFNEVNYIYNIELNSKDDINFLQKRDIIYDTLNLLIEEFFAYKRKNTVFKQNYLVLSKNFYCFQNQMHGIILGLK